MASFSDNFNRADGALGSNWTADATWGGLSVFSNAARGGFSDAVSMVATSAADFSDDHYAEVEFSVVGNFDLGGPVVRWDGDGNGYLLILDGVTGNNRGLFEVTGGTETRLSLTEVTVSTGDVVRLIADGTTISVEVNGSEVISVTDATHSSGQPGMYYNAQNSRITRLDNFDAADLGGGDVTAPTVSSATAAANGANAATASVSTDEDNGTLYWVITTSATAPSVAQIQAGNDNSGTAAADSGSQSVSGTGTQTISPAPSGLTAGTTYYAHFQHQDTATNDSTVVSSSSFTTLGIDDPGAISFTIGTADTVDLTSTGWTDETWGVQ